ncbi:MAG: phosphoglucosamine mutase [Marinilabiliaceae bacterium]|nr:phosphoglucosamine mutase [Marinilabiliaceae bacterium]
MSLIKSISGIRGTIGGRPSDGLSPLDVVKFTSAYAVWVTGKCSSSRPKVVVGRDARMSGAMVEQLVVATLQGMGVDVVNIGLATTPTTELAVTAEKADGGIIITASHNPKQWNALKLLNADGEFLNAEEGQTILATAAADDFSYAEVDKLGKVECKDYSDYHIQKVLDLKLVNVEAIRKAGFRVALDTINSVGGLILPKLLERLGVTTVTTLNAEPTGCFFHTPEPLPENLTQISQLMKSGEYDVAFVVDPDVDRLAIICENGDMFGEEYTIVSCADYVLRHTPGNTVSNLSSSRALADVTRSLGGKYEAAAVGEVNVVTKMKATQAVIGGEGNGGVIYPESHYGRDALVGIALFLSNLAISGKRPSELRASYPEYCISKNKIQLSEGVDVDGILSAMKQKYANERITDIDGVKIDFKDSWVHLRKSNTEPIIRIYAEAHTIQEADKLAEDIKAVINSL